MQVTLDQIYGKIRSETYVVLNDGRTTVCQLTLQNGYTVNGMSACVDAKDFDRDTGRKYAYENAVQAIWPLEGYLLAEKMFQDSEDQRIIDDMFIKSGNSQIVALKKKPHWTQTPEGKKILANRKPRGKKK
jgi:cell division protein YceG involved in septum cleavage